MNHLFKELTDIAHRNTSEQTCPNCLGHCTECYDGNEYGNAFICNDCAEDFVVLPTGEIETYGKNPEYVRRQHEL